MENNPRNFTRSPTRPEVEVPSAAQRKQAFRLLPFMTNGPLIITTKL